MKSQQNEAGKLLVSHPATGKVFKVAEADASDWIDSWPTYLADGIPVSEGVGNVSGAIFCFWVGDGDPTSSEIQKTIESFLEDHDVVGVRFVRAAPTKVHPAIAAQFESTGKPPREEVL